MYKLRLRNDEYNLLAKLLVELGSIEDDRNQRDRYMDILASVMSARDGCSLDYGEIAPILDVLSKCLNNVINFSIAIGCKSDELMELAASIALQLNEQNLDHFKIRR